MILLVALLSLQDSDYSRRLGELHHTLAEERRKIAEALEGMKAWGLARAEYQKLLRVEADDDEAKKKLRGEEAIPLQNERLTSETRARAAELLSEFARVASSACADLARWCDGHGMHEEALSQWRFALFYSPTHGEALRTLGFWGVGAAAVDPLWKDVKWKELISKADAGSVTTEMTEIEKKWSVKNNCRFTPSMQWEGVNVSQARLTTLAKLGEAELLFMRKLLGEEKLGFCVDRIVVMTGHESFVKYVEDFFSGPKSSKDLLKIMSGTENVLRREFAMCVPEGDSKIADSYISHSIPEFALAATLGIDDYDKTPAWLKEGIGCTAELLFRDCAEASCIAMPESTMTGGIPWSLSDRWNDNLGNLVAQGKDCPMGDLACVDLNAMKGDQRAKSASVVTFLALRWPQGFRGLIAEARKNPKDVSAQFGSGLGLSTEEFDEFWRRWVRAK